ncbi:MAG: branched-chain amino acid ABC transporter permease [Desulfarculaceae bacterium]|nr:branched-chain amino acid ABC transporter permease [Desulfarculaceae bacterium]MCF8071523.1 branched-chain amino acid ABC transporter permease [Desulfarculaceae bacterium]MCF8102338.1 branched-chain amino acid ABC transporter permease [Desulfarculaceae bacterium]MCF8114802.1 branched-chain amino acid ABC transporter permease [Desulfarculaceae bacterium]
MPKLAPKGLVILAALALPLVFNEAFYQHIMIAAVINIILAVSLGIIVGYIGELSLAHGAFYGIGAYTSALLMVKLGLPFVAAFPLSVVSAGFMGLIIGIPSLRLSGHYFAIATLGFQGIVVLLIINLVDLTRGPMGLPGIPSPGTLEIFGWTISFGDKLAFYYLAFAVMIVVLILVRNLLRYKFGEAFIATREDSLLAASLGVHPRNCRMLAFVVSTALAGAAGSLYAHYTMFISPDSFTLGESIYLVTMVIVGGRGTIVGPVVGAVLLTALPEVLRFAGDLQFVIYGLMLMLVVIFLPKGIVGLVEQTKQRGASLEN